MLILQVSDNDGPIHLIDELNGETIVKLHILKSRNKAVRLGLEADQRYTLLREKVVEREKNND